MENMENPSIISVIKNWLSTYKIPITIVGIVLIFAGLVTTEKVLEITENPAFCGKNCHIMRPYYDSWRSSLHNDIKCVECHYEPGVIGHIKGKINGLMQFFSYETTTSDSSEMLNAKVSDSNCLTCHEKRIFSSNVTYGDINFSHSEHLQSPKRGIQLTCTSCHSMIVIGMKEHQSVTDPSCSQCHPNIAPQNDIGHLVVTNATCFTCHFRNVPGNTSISGCPSCHGPPKQIFGIYTNFNHTIHLDKGFQCTTCHTNISTGADNVVPTDKCLTCHTQRDRLGSYGNFNLTHKVHVSDNKIACYNCHSVVTHSPAIKENLCTTCHSNQHPSNWLTTHKTQVLGGEECSSCHQPSFCSDCHATGVSSGKIGVNKSEVSMNVS